MIHAIWKTFWLLFVAATVIVSAAGQALLTFLYKSFPFPSVLDTLYQHSSSLRRIFAYHLGLQQDYDGAEGIIGQPTQLGAAAVPSAADLIRYHGWGCQEHQAITSDGYVLGLQRIVAPSLDPLARVAASGRNAHGAYCSRAESVHHPPSETTTSTDPAGEHDPPILPANRSTAPISGSAPSLSTAAGSEASASAALEAASSTSVPPGPGPCHAQTQSRTRTTHPDQQPVEPPTASIHRNSPTFGPPVLLLHGLMQCSDTFVCGGHESLGFLLAEAGYDVWLGNVRGNRYSGYHTDPERHQGTESFWKFGLDDVARRDVPAMVRAMQGARGARRGAGATVRMMTSGGQLDGHVGDTDGGADEGKQSEGSNGSTACITTGGADPREEDEEGNGGIGGSGTKLGAAHSEKVSIVGFSYGTAVTFCSLAANPSLANNVRCFVALAPAIAVRGLQRSVVSSLLETEDQGTMFRLLFGGMAMVPYAAQWQRILSVGAWADWILVCMRFLFGWECGSWAVPRARMEGLMQHVFSLASVRTVQHWFQAIRSGQLRCFDGAGNSAPASGHSVPPAYPFQSIGADTRILCLTGERDTVLDLPRLRSQLPAHAGVLVFPELEHLCVLWGAGVAAGASSPHAIALGFMWRCGGGKQAGCLSAPGPLAAGAAAAGLVAVRESAKGGKDIGEGKEAAPWVPGWNGEKEKAAKELLGKGGYSVGLSDGATCGSTSCSGNGNGSAEIEIQEAAWRLEVRRACEGVAMYRD